MSKQDFGPWGNVRSGGITQTTRNFTGQRRDGTGLLYYNARYYDPALARFVSADTIGFDLKQPQSTNRYSYVLNNPVTLTDPTGQCSINPADERNGENERCRTLQDELGRYGYTIGDLEDWKSWELQLLRDASEQLRTTAGWSFADFQNALGSILLLRAPEEGDKFAQTGADNGRRWIEVYDAMFADGPADQRNNAKYTFVGELAHVWDARSGGKLTAGLVKATNGQLGADGNYVTDAQKKPVGQGDAASTYASSQPGEDFAAAVALTVYGPRPNERRIQYQGSSRDQYVRAQFAQYQTCKRRC